MKTLSAKRRSIFITLPALILLAVSACGGGGSGGPPPREQINAAPVAQVSLSTFTGKVNHSITVSGSQSFDANQDSLSYAWRLVKPDNSNASIIGSGESVSFLPDVPGYYEVEITVSDGVFATTQLSDPIGVTPAFINEDCSADTLYLTADGYEFKGCKDVYFNPPLFLSDGSVVTNNAGHAVAVWYDDEELHATFFDGTDWSNRITIAQFGFNNPGGPLLVRLSENDVTAIVYSGVRRQDSRPDYVMLAYMERAELRQVFEAPFERAEIDSGGPGRTIDGNRLLIDNGGIAHVMLDTFTVQNSIEEGYWSFVSFGPGGVTNQQSFIYPDQLYKGLGGMDANSLGEIVAVQTGRIGDSQMSRLVGERWTTPETLPNIGNLAFSSHFTMGHLDDGSIHLIYRDNDRHWAIIDDSGDRMIDAPAYYTQRASFSYDRQGSRIIMYYPGCKPGTELVFNCPGDDQSYFVNVYQNGGWSVPTEVPDANNIDVTSYYIGNDTALLVGNLGVPRPFRLFNMSTFEVSPIRVINVPQGNTVLGYSTNDTGLMTIGSTVNVGDSLILYTLQLDLSGQ